MKYILKAGMPEPFSSTPNLMPGVRDGRAVEIQAWLDAHADLVDPCRWVAIDDIQLTPELPEEHVITTSPPDLPIFEILKNRNFPKNYFHASGLFAN